MKLSIRYFVIFMALAITLLAGYAKAEASDYLPTKVPLTFKRIYAVEGFDDNDNVQFVGEGIFSSSCYRYADTTVNVNHLTKEIRISSQSFKYNGVCMQLILPFNQVINVGLLQSGTYKIVQDQTGAELGELPIKAATNKEADDNLYAPISQAMLQTKQGRSIVTLTGDFPSSCMKLGNVESHVLTDSIVLQPVTEVAGTDCTDGKFPFETEVDLGTVKPGRYLLHVRSMNGNSVNTLVNIP